MSESLSILRDSLPYLLRGTYVTLTVVCGALLFGLALGLPLAVGQVYGNGAFRRCVGAYVWFFRGIPLLVLLFLFYFGLFPFIGLNLSAFSVAILVLGLISAAYQAQIFRGAILSLPEGQMKAARALGMSDARAVLLVILPQALRLSLPAWSNEYSILLKDSAVTYALGVAELMARAHHVASRTYQHLALYLCVGFLFMILTFMGTRALAALHRRVHIQGYSQ